jgi:hypothetical protein
MNCLMASRQLEDLTRPRGSEHRRIWEGSPYNYHNSKGTQLPGDDFGLFLKGKVKIKMLDYVNKMLADLPAEIDGEAPSPVAKHLLTVNDDRIKVDETKAQLFHTYVAKTLFSMQAVKTGPTNSSCIF